MENPSVDAKSFTPSSPGYEHSCPGWKSVRDVSVPLVVFSAVLNILMSFLSIGGSILLIVVILTFQQLRRIPSNLLLCSLAASDLLVGLLVQPYHSAMILCALRSDGSPSWLDLMPKFIPGYFGSFLTHLSCLNIATLTLDRYLCITYSLQYHDTVTNDRVVMVTAVNWAVSLTLPAMRFIPPFPVTSTVIRILQIIVISSVLFVIVFCYVKIFRIAQRHKRQIICQLQSVSQGPREQEFQSANTVFIVVAAVILCYTPLLVLQFCFIFIPFYDRLKIVHSFAITFVLLHSSLNPIIIFYRSRKLRRCVRCVKKLFKRKVRGQ